MNRYSRPMLALTLAAVVHLGAAAEVWAHGSGWSQESAFSVVLSFYYADQTPMAYSEVQIFSPAEAGIPHQKGRSDRNGFFVFKPDVPGIWSFSAADGQGHLSQGEVEVAADQLNPENVSAPPGAAVSSRSDLARPEVPLARGGASAEGPDPLKIALGLSLIANLAFIVLWRKALGKNKRQSAAQ
ncbi:MAG: hypothetical protein LBS31_08025 [Candidatus Adiutrix sp.]|jgi:nickel transport protein|nr:hypothetical protein [Candidatus Adiutrix sp.]